MAAAHTHGVLHDVDESVRSFLRLRCEITRDIEVSFDAPTRDWSSRRNTPTIDVFLYDLRENLDRRQTLLEDHRDETGMVDRRPPATRWFNCSYLITAWTQRAEDEHRLLSSVLIGFLTDHTLPREVLSGALAQTERAVYITIARPPGQDRSISDIWSAVGGELKPSLDLVVVVPFEPLIGSLPFGPPVVEAPSVELTDGGGVHEAGRTRARAPKQRTGTPALIERRRTENANEEVMGGTAQQPGRRLRGALFEPPSHVADGRRHDVAEQSSPPEKPRPQPRSRRT